MAKKQKNEQATSKSKKNTAPGKSKAVVSKQVKPRRTAPPLPPDAAKSEFDEAAPRFIVRGVVSYPDHSSAAGLTVIAFDKDVAGEDRLDEATTDAKGNYQITYSAAQFRRSKSERGGADIFVRILGAQGELLFQTKPVRNAPADLQVNVELPAGQFVVRGQVRLADGSPCVGAVVRAFDRDLRKDQQIAEAESDDQGQYILRYGTKDFASGDVPAASAPKLIVRAFAGDQQIGEDVSRPKPTHDEVINFEIPAPVLSEWERLCHGVLPLLLGQGEGDHALPPWEINDHDRDYIAEETGLDKEQIRLWALAFGRDAAVVLQSGDVTSTNRTEIHTHLDSISADGLSNFAIFYGWFRLGAESSSLWTTPTDKLITNLKAAIDQHIVPSNISGKLDGISARIEQIKLDRILEAPVLGSTTSLADLLAMTPVPLNLDQQRAIAAALPELRPDDPQLVQRIADVPGFDGDAIGVTRTLRLGALTAGHRPLAQALQSKLEKADESEGTLRPLAALRPDEWIDLAYTHGTPDGLAITPIAYADALAESIEQQHPTATLAAHLADGRRLGQQVAMTDVGTFLRNNPKFNIVTANLNMFTEEAALGDVAEPNQLVEGLRMLQRMNAFDVRWDEAATLLESGIESPQALLDAGPGQLNVQLKGKFPPDRITDLHARAERLQSATIAAFTAAMSPLSGPRIMPNPMYIINGGDPPKPGDLPGGGGLGPPPPGPVPNDDGAGFTFDLVNLQEVLAARDGGFDPNRYKSPPPVPSKIIPDQTSQLSLGGEIARQPTLQSLFGAQDACACGHCNSVLSPAAYFIDVLQFIKNAAPQERMLAALLQRRPDLQDLELSCDNTNTEVPAIDLALEILENAVSVPLAVPLLPGTNVEAQLRAPIGEAVKTALKRTVRNLAGEVRAEPEGDTWTVVDGHRRWKLTAQKEQALQAEAGSKRWPLQTAGLSLPALIIALDDRRVPLAAESAFAQLFANSWKQPPEFANYDVTITPLVAGQSWRVEYHTVAHLVIGRKNNKPELQTAAGHAWLTNTYGKKSIVAVRAELAKEVVPKLVRILLEPRFPDTTELVVKRDRADLWKIESVKRELTLTFTPASLTITSLAYQSGDASTDAIAESENHNPEAYERLKEAKFPWSLPLDLPLEQTRLFLERARTSRRQLIELMLPVDRSQGEDPIFANEVLGLSDAEARIITLPSANSDCYENWGLVSNQKSIPDAAAGRIIMGDGPLSLLKTVSILLQQSRLSFKELQTAIETEFVSAQGDAPLRIEPRGTCKPSEMKLPALTPAHLDRLHRFTRLWRNLGWTMHELDLAIQAFGGQLKPDTLISLARLQRLKEQLEIPLASLVGGLHQLETQPWTDDIDGGAPLKPSLYAVIFQREPVRSASNHAAFLLQTNGTELANPANLGISVHAEYIGACLGIKSTVVAGWVAGTQSLGIADKLNLANLSRLTAAASLCRALGLDPEKLTQHLKLYGTTASPFQTGISPHERADAMLEFISRFRLVEQSGIDVETLRYLLQHYEAPGTNATLSEKKLIELARTVREAVRSIPETAEEAQYFTQAEAAEAARTIRLTREEAVIAPLATGLGAPRELVADLLRTRLRHPSNPNKPAIGVFLSSVGDFIDLSGLVKKLRTQSDPLSKAIWTGFSLPHQQALNDPTATTLHQQTAVVSELNQLLRGASLYSASRFDGVTLSEETLMLKKQRLIGANRLRLNRLLLEDAYPLQIAKHQSLDVSFIVGEVSPPREAAIENAIGPVLIRLHKSVLVCDALKFSRTDLNLLATSSTEKCGFIALAFTTLPVALDTTPTTIGTAAKLGDFERLLLLAQLRDLAPGAADLLHHYAALNFADAGSADTARTILATGLGLEEREVAATSDHIQVTLDQVRDPIALTRLIELLIGLKQLGATVTQAIALAAPSPTDAAAVSARTLLRAKYGDSNWHDLIKPIADKLRERQRDALVDYLIARDQLPRDGDENPQIYTGHRLRDADDLYERYLIDVQTGSCMKTTRLLQATAAAQLFVQRVLLNLEQGLCLSDDKRQVWVWTDRYRVWEANRKVFLFPENWLLPELRDDKTATFRQMESALTEGEPSPEVTRAALLGYVEELADLAQIRVIAMYQDHRIVDQTASADGKTTDTIRPTLYVVGRTPNTPYHYFWRTCSDFGTSEMQWSGWEALDLDNANDFIMPFVFEGDLHIAWPIFHKIKEETKNETDSAQLWWDVQLAWTRRTNKGWVKRKIGKAALDKLTRLPKIDESRSFAFRLRKTSLSVPGGDFLDDESLKRERITIDCYIAKELIPIPSLKVDPSWLNSRPIGYSLSPNNDPGRQWNVGLLVEGTVYRYFDLGEKDGGQFNQAYENVIVELIDAERQNRENAGDNTDEVPFWTTTNPADGSFKINLLTQVPKPKNADEGLLNGGSLKLRFRVGGTLLYETPTVKLVKEISGDLPEYSFNWTWKIAFGVKDPTIKQKWDENRIIKHVKSKTFVLETGRDLSTSEQPDYVPYVDDQQREDILYVNDEQKFVAENNGLNDRERRGTPISAVRATKSSGAEEPNIWSIKESEESFSYLQLAGSKWHRWPDRQPFVSLYRKNVASSSSALFRLENQEHLHIDPDANNFNRETAYANYNWELFLHAPLAIADYLASQQRFEEARRWLHAIFDPTTDKKDGNTIPQFWRFLPFDNMEQPDAIAKLLTWLAEPTTGDGKIEQDLKKHIDEWKNNPFMPHLIARLRPSAYQWYAFFAYLDVLIGWGDQLFRRDTRESVNEATLLYILAAKLLGPRPRVIAAPTPPPIQTYRSLKAKELDAFGNVWLSYFDLPGIRKMTSKEPATTASSFSSHQWGGKLGVGTRTRTTIENSREIPKTPLPLGSLAFCIPQNEKVTEFYDRIERRLFNVRNCRNIDGVFRNLPLYEPPIDPLLLIRARAAGLDIDSVIDGLYAPLPHYRFIFTLQKALELAAELKALGGALLATLEKSDAEELTLLRSSHELVMLRLVSDTRKRQQAEAEANIVALLQSEETIKERFGQYQKLLGKSGTTNGQDGLPVVEQSSSLTVSTDPVGGVSGLGLSRMEVSQLVLTAVAHHFTQAANSGHVVAGILSLIPNLTVGSPFASSSFGGSFLGSAASATAKAIEMGAAEASFLANQMGTFGGYERRQDEWVHQSKLALAELKQIKKQIIAAEIRKEIADLEVRNHEKQIENAEKVDEFMHGKFTNQQLYRWMSSQIAEVYFRTYQLALDQAKRAELTYRFELGMNAATASFIGSGYWDSLKKGLMAGDRLYHDLKRMELAYLNQNKREFELVKHISLVLLDPLALIKLRETGRCFFRLPEEIFDLDYPGHYFRRIKSVSLTLPCVVGPYTTISCTLRLLKNSIRINTANGDNGYPRNTDNQDLPADDDRFVENNIPVKAIAASNAQNDSGVFELNFRDERYLPFEGAGASSEWSLELFSDLPSNNPDPAMPDFGKPLRQFDYGTISDAVVHIKYTAREDTGQFKNGAISHLREYFSQAGTKPSLRMFNLRQEFPTQWHSFLHPINPATGNVLAWEMSPSLFPFRDSWKTLKINTIAVLARCTATGSYTATVTPLLPVPPPENAMNLVALDQYGGLRFNQRSIDLEIDPTVPPVEWQLRMTGPGGHLQEDPVKKVMEVEDLILVLGYAWK